jgi:hypothetical protein
MLYGELSAAFVRSNEQCPPKDDSHYRAYSIKNGARSAVFYLR